MRDDFAIATTECMCRITLVRAYWVSRRAFSLVELLIVLAILALLAALTAVGVVKVRDSSQRCECANTLRQIGTALHSYHERYGSLPAGIVHPLFRPGIPRIYGPDKDAHPFMTWEMRILPFLGEEALWVNILDAYRQDPYVTTSPPHTAFRVSVRSFICAADGVRGPSPIPKVGLLGTTSYLGVSGLNRGRQDGVFYMDSYRRFSEITDGLSNTIAVGERPPSLDLTYGRWHTTWGQWGDVNTYLGVREIAPWNRHRMGCSEGPYDFQPGSLSNPCSVFHFWSFHSGGANFLFCDGSVRFLSYSANSILPAFATRAGGESASIP